MYCSIGKQLGAVLADCENDLDIDIGNVEALKKVTLVSEAYRNFVAAGKPGFTADFEDGYREVWEFRISERTKWARKTPEGPTEPNQG